MIGIAFIFVSVEITMKIGAKSVGLGTKAGKASGLLARDYLRASATQKGGLLNRVPGVKRIAPFIPWTPIYGLANVTP